MPVWSRASDKRSYVLPSPDDGPAHHARSSLKRDQGGHESPAPSRSVGFRVWLWRVLVVNVVVVLVFIFSMSLYFPPISTESVVDQALMQGERTAVPRGPQGYVNLGTTTTEPDIVPASTAPGIEPTTTIATNAQERETELLEPTKAKLPEATDGAVLATAIPLELSAIPAIVSDAPPAPSDLPATTEAVSRQQNSDHVPLPPTPSVAVEEVTSIPVTTPAAEIQASTSAPSIAPANVETASPESTPTTQAQLPKNVADLIWALKNKSKMPNAVEQSLTKPDFPTAPPSVASELSTEAKKTNSQPSVFPANTRSTKEFLIATEPQVALPATEPTESNAPAAVAASTHSATQAPVVSTPPLPPQTINAVAPPPSQSNQVPDASPTEEPQQTSPFGDTNIFEWQPPAQLHAENPDRERRVIEWRQSVNDAVQSVRNSVIGGEQLRSLIRQRRDELLALRQQLFG